MMIEVSNQVFLGAEILQKKKINLEYSSISYISAIMEVKGFEWVILWAAK